MTLVTRRLSTIRGANGGVAYIEATWDDKGEQEDGTFLDPNATMLVSALGYQNLTEKARHASVGGVIFPMPAGTAPTTLSIPKPKQTRMDSFPYFSLA